MNLMTIQEASNWARHFLNRKITPSNISYLIQYGRVPKIQNDGKTLINKKDLKEYYQVYYSKEDSWKKQLGEDLNWMLSFDTIPERERTKHVHRLHPYKGKFIPQLVEYFLDTHTDDFKKNSYFKKGDILLDPFAGSGTMLVQANELGMNAIGVDVSEFNCLISNAKIKDYDLSKVAAEIDKINEALDIFISKSNIPVFEDALKRVLTVFNLDYFPGADFRYKVNNGEIDEYQYGREKIMEFLPIYNELVDKFNIKLRQEKNIEFLDKWYIQNVRNEMEFILSIVAKINNTNIKNIISIILSRVIRSCRATTHANLATLREPIYAPYYCRKHKKICKPLFSIKKHWDRYSKDTIRRLSEFRQLRTDTQQYCLQGDSRNIDIYSELEKVNPKFAELIKTKKINGIFSSPPYVGLINYHEQHAYAYELFGFSRRDKLEIGPLYNGQGRQARESYIEGVSKVLLNCKRFLADDYNVFLVANDKYNIYPAIADKAGMQIVNQFKRPVLNRTEKDKNAYAEIIFHLKEK